MMKPEYFTWKASSHEKITCVDCHVNPGLADSLLYNFTLIKRLALTLTHTYTFPIKPLAQISNEACKECHNMEKRRATVTGDLIISHSLHDDLGVDCAKCHSTVTHANIANKKVTYSSDYRRWNETIGQSMMNDNYSIRPDMDVCMRCHQLRKAPLGCEACHYTVMIPEDHKNEPFKEGGHGKLADSNLVYCDSCHQYMTEVQVEGLQEVPIFMEYLRKSSEDKKTVTVPTYAKANTYCIDCHRTRPPSHKQERFMMNHGLLADAKKSSCTTCHNVNPGSVGGVTNIACNSCHPSPHREGWRVRHPFDVPSNGMITESCYRCHPADRCGGCHGK